MNSPIELHQGRGAPANPANRFEKLHLEPDEEADPGEDKDRRLTTQFFKDATASAITYNDSPDVGFEASVNPYRGCEHGCIYCFARPTHEYLGFSAGLDFESRILVKERAPDLLRDELSSPKWKPRVVARDLDGVIAVAAKNDVGAIDRLDGVVAVVAKHAQGGIFATPHTARPGAQRKNEG